LEAYTRDFGFGSLDPVPATSVIYTLTALRKPLKTLRKIFSLFSIGYKLLFLLGKFFSLFSTGYKSLFLLRKNFPYISMG